MHVGIVGTKRKKIDASIVKIGKTTGFDVINTTTTNNLSNLIDVGFGDDGKNYDIGFRYLHCIGRGCRVGCLHDGTAQRLLCYVSLCAPNALRTGGNALRDQQHIDRVVHDRYCVASYDRQRGRIFAIAMGCDLASLALR